MLLEATWPERREARLGAPASQGGVPHRWERFAHHRHREACQNRCGAWGQPPPNPARGERGAKRGPGQGPAGRRRIARRSRRGVPKSESKPEARPHHRVPGRGAGGGRGQGRVPGDGAHGEGRRAGTPGGERGASRVAVGVQQTRTTLGRVQGSSRGVGRTCSGSHPARCATQEGGGPGAGEHSRSAGMGEPATVVLRRVRTTVPLRAQHLAPRQRRLAQQEGPGPRKQPAPRPRIRGGGGSRERRRTVVGGGPAVTSPGRSRETRSGRDPGGGKRGEARRGSGKRPA